MGKQSGKNKKPLGDSSYESHSKSFKASENSPRAYDKDTALFISMSQDLKEEGNRLFQRRDYEGAMLKYEKAIKLLPRNHINVSYLRSNIAECYMQLGIAEFPKAIHECNLALEVTPKYTKALLKRARCYEALNRLDLALRDVGTVLKMEQNNLMAVEIEERVKNAISRRGSGENEGSHVHLVPLPEYLDSIQSPRAKVSKVKTPKKESSVAKEKFGEKSIDRKVEAREDDEKTSNKVIEEIEADKKTKNRQIKGREADEKTSNRKIKAREEADVCVITTGESDDRIEEKKTEDKLVVEEEGISNGNEEKPGKTVKLVFGEDIRWAQIPLSCDFLKLREIVANRFPSSKAVLIKYRDQEGDLVTITTAEEMKLAEKSAQNGTFKLFVVEVSPDQDPFFEKVTNMGIHKDYYHPNKKGIPENGLVVKAKEPRIESACISDWIVKFAHFFKNHVGFDADSYIDLHENAIKLYSDAMEETVTSEEAQDLFSEAADKFQEMAALALFNWGNVHMARARKRVYFPEDSSKEQVLSQVISVYDWAITEYIKAGEKYEKALKIKPDFYEAVLALGQQQFERAKLSWYYAVGTSINLETWPSTEALQLYNSAEENMEKGMEMWEESEARRIAVSSQPNKIDNLLKKMKLGGVLKNAGDEEADERASTMRSQINVIWGTMLCERSIMEFKLGLPVWRECLEIALEKFEIAGASPSDIAVMVKNHCSNDTALEGLGFNIDEIIQAWNEMYEAKRWQRSVPSFRLEPLLRRRVSKLYHALEIQL